jgi:hypothetical protein
MDWFTASRAPSSRRSTLSSLVAMPTMSVSTPEAGRVVAGYGEGALALISATSGELEAQIRLPGHPESFQLERGGQRIFVNVPDAHQITVVDRSTASKLRVGASPTHGPTSQWRWTRPTGDL